LDLKEVILTAEKINILTYGDLLNNSELWVILMEKIANGKNTRLLLADPRVLIR
jgi:hypothetical protein